MFSGNTESLNYAGNDGTCDHSWLTMLLGNAPQVSWCVKWTSEFVHQTDAVGLFRESVFCRFFAHI